MSIFYDYNGVFQWASIAALVAGGSAIFSIVFSFINYLNVNKTLNYQKEIDQKKIDTELIAMTRINGVQDIRNEMSNLLTLAQSLSNEYDSFTNVEKQYNELEAKKVVMEINTSISKLRFMFVDDSGIAIKDVNYEVVLRERVEMISFFRIGTASLDKNDHFDIIRIIEILRQTNTNKGKDEVIVAFLNIVKSRLQYNSKSMSAIGSKLDSYNFLYVPISVINNLSDVIRLYLKVELELAKKIK
ncbi:hypothetical protein [Vagococcus fluvialis]|uniref:hypothetical protein n=1 Tax=Vagococcus fluvialis TaxID=2738 RepID=UPI001A8D845C|nr:hypothetical protein [Vagococcus fluvialis]MBO0486999.1 hypothetical protein [Vagococcus fluvialis]